jgi:hypothetical protein
METIHKDERARAQAGAQLASIEELVRCLQHAEEFEARQNCEESSEGDCIQGCMHEAEAAQVTIQEDALSVDVRTDWHGVGAIEACKPTDYKILLCWGGPAVQIIGTLDDYNQPDSAQLQYQDWFTEWMDYPLTEEEEETVITYAQQFYFDE